jgi:drug/metabolite transporter (DMT)-like permease
MYGLFTGLLYGIAITCTAYVGRHTDTLTWAAVSFYGGALVSLMVKPSAIKKIQPMLKGEMLTRLLLLGLFYAIGSTTMLFAYKYGTLTLVSPLRQTSIIVTVLLALVFLKPERNRIGRKILAAILCFIGVALIVI